MLPLRRFAGERAGGGAESIHPHTASGTPTTSPSRCFATGPALSPAKARRRGSLSVNSFDGVSRDQNRRFGPVGVIKAAMSDRAPSVSSSDLRLSDSQIFPLYSSSIEPWKMSRARSRTRRLALDVNVSPLIFRLLKALPSGNYRNLLMRMVRSRLSSKELLESHILAHALNDRDEARCVNAIATSSWGERSCGGYSARPCFAWAPPASAAEREFES